MAAPQREAGFDKFLRRLSGVANVANAGINTYSGVKDMQAKSQAADDVKNAIYADKDQDPTKLVPAMEGESNAFMRKVRRGDEIKDEWFKNLVATEKAKSPEELALLKSQAAKNWADAGKTKSEANSVKSDWDKLAPPDQEIAKDLSKKNASKVAIKNQIDAVMSGWDALPEDQKVAQGRQLIKVLNSSEGADAVGSEEAKRLGGKLEFAMGNFTNSNPMQFGRDLGGFKEQATLTSKGLGSAISANQDQVRRIAGPAAGRGLSNLISEPKQVAKNPEAASQFAKMSDDELTKLYNAKKMQEQKMRAR